MISIPQRELAARSGSDLCVICHKNNGFIVHVWLQLRCCSHECVVVAQATIMPSILSSLSISSITSTGQQSARGAELLSPARQGWGKESIQPEPRRGDT